MTRQLRHPANRKFRTTLLASLMMAAVTIAGCAAGGSEDEVATIRYQGWASQVYPMELAEDLGYFNNIDLEWVGDTTSGPQDIQAVATGEVDVGGAFNGAVVKLIAAGAPITPVIAHYGADENEYNGYFVREDSDIHEARDLIGKSVGMNTLGAHHEFVVREWLAQEGLSPEEIAQVNLTVVPPINGEDTLRRGQIDVQTIGGIFRRGAEERGDIRPLFTDQSLFGNFSYGTQVFRDDFIEKNPEAVEDYVQGVSRAIRWTQTQPREVVIDRFRSIIDKRGRNENTEFVENWNSYGVAGPGGEIRQEELQIWIDWLVREGELEEGDLSADEIYTNEYIPYVNGTYDPATGPDGEQVGEQK